MAFSEFYGELHRIVTFSDQDVCRLPVGIADVDSDGQDFSPRGLLVRLNLMHCIVEAMLVVSL